MTSRPFPDQLDDAADTAGDRDLAALLRRAAIRLRNTDGITFDEDVEAALAGLGVELEADRKAAIRHLVREALVASGKLPWHELDEDGDVEGRA